MITNTKQVHAASYPIPYHKRNALKSELDEVATCERYSTFKITFTTDKKWNIITDSSYSLKNQISALEQVLKNNRADIHEYVDVRVEGVAYIK